MEVAAAIVKGAVSRERYSVLNGTISWKVYSALEGVEVSSKVWYGGGRSSIAEGTAASCKIQYRGKVMKQERESYSNTVEGRAAS